MGRVATGFRIIPQPGTDVLAVAWTQPDPKGGNKGRQIQRTTGERDWTKAAARGAQIYAAAIRGEKLPKQRTQRLSADDLYTLGIEWLNEHRKDLDEYTRATYELYFETHLGPFFKTLENVSPESVKAYGVQRLAQVSAGTLRHELSTLRMMLRWALDDEQAEALVPKLPKSTRGTSYEQSNGKRRRGKPTDLTEAETRAIIEKLPEWSRLPRQKKPMPSAGSGPSRGGATTLQNRRDQFTTSRFPIRTRFVVKYETGLREALLDQISIPEHWDPSKPSELRITHELDKMRYVRTVPLTPVAQAALLEATSQGTRAGVVFGAHDYRAAVRAAALSAGLPLHRVRVLAPNDLRHARATAIGAHPAATMTGMMHMFGWTQPATAARYMHPSKAAAETMLGALPVSPASSKWSGTEPPVSGSTSSLPAAQGPHDDDTPQGFG
jgi:integrase